MVGRPKKYNLEELEKKLEEYWAEIIVEGKIMSTKANLLLKLDITRETYNQWKKKEHEFSDTLKKTELRIEDVWLQKLVDKNCTGSIFYLKNAFKEHYKDRYETDLTTAGKPIPLLNGQSNGNNNSSNNKTTETEKET